MEKKIAININLRKKRRKFWKKIATKFRKKNVINSGKLEQNSCSKSSGKEKGS